MGFKVNETTDVALAIWGRQRTNTQPWSTVETVAEGDAYAAIVYKYMETDGDSATVYKLYLTTNPMANAKLTVGKFPFQLTRYTLKLADPDVYTVIPKFDEGNYIVSGGKLDLDVKPAKVSLFAAKNTGPEGLNIRVTTRAGAVDIEQLAGVRVEVPNLIELVPSLGLTYYRAATATDYRRADVYGADIVIAPPVKGLFISGEWAKTKSVKDEIPTLKEDNTALDATVSYAVTNDLKVKAGYKQIKQNFYAPGYWDRILWWKSPNNIKGPYADVSYTLMKDLALDVHAGFYKIDKDGNMFGFTTHKDDTINHYLTGVKYALTPKIGLQLGYEYGQYKDKVQSITGKAGYLTFGVSYELGKDAALNVLYQNINIKPGGNAPDQKGDLIVTQVSVKF
jgi:predicted porin